MSKYGHGMNCYHCDECHLSFGIDSLQHIDDPSCPNCGSEDITSTGEKLVGNYVVEDDEEESSKVSDLEKVKRFISESMERYEKDRHMLDWYNAKYEAFSETLDFINKVEG